VSDVDTQARAERVIRRLLARAIGLDQAEMDEIPADTDIFGSLGLTSLGGVALLTGIREELGVDVADLDLDLRSMETIATLRDFVSQALD
jgi:acyl carrier protein